MMTTLAVAYLTTVVGQLASQGFYFLVLRVLPISAVGLYSWAIAVATIAGYVGDFGLASFLVGEMSSRKYSFASFVRILFGARLLLLPFGVVGIWMWSRFGNASSRETWVLTILCLTYLLQLLDGGLFSWFQVNQHQSSANIVALVGPVSRVIAMGWLVVRDQPATLSYVVGLYFGTQVLNTFCLYILALLGTAESPAAPVLAWTEARQLVTGFFQRGPRLAFMYTISIAQARLDWILVAAIVSRIALANYSIANKLVELAMLIAGVWAKTSFPWMSREDSDQPYLQVRLTLIRHLFIVASGIINAFLFFWSSPIVHWLFGDKYAGSDPTISLMTSATALFMINQYFFYVLLAKRLEGLYTMVILFSTFAQVVADLILLPRIGILGAAVGMLIMGGGTHLGQSIILVRVKVLRCTEIARMELFLVLVSFGPFALSAAGLSLINATWIMFALIITVGTWLVLNRSDRVYLIALLRGETVSNALPR